MVGGVPSGSMEMNEEEDIKASPEVDMAQARWMLNLDCFSMDDLMEVRRKMSAHIVFVLRLGERAIMCCRASRSAFLCCFRRHSSRLRHKAL